MYRYLTGAQASVCVQVQVLATDVGDKRLVRILPSKPGFSLDNEQMTEQQVADRLGAIIQEFFNWSHRNGLLHRFKAQADGSYNYGPRYDGADFTEREPMRVSQ